MTAASVATSSLRILSLVLGVDYRHPVQTHKALATLDVLSGGRVEAGLRRGGRLRSEYESRRDPVPALRGTARAAGRSGRGDHSPLRGDTRDLRGSALPNRGARWAPEARAAPSAAPAGGRLWQPAADARWTCGGHRRDLPAIDAGRRSGHRADASRTGDARCQGQHCSRRCRVGGEEPGRPRAPGASVLAVHLTDVHDSGWCSSQLSPELARSEALRDSPAILVGLA